MAVLEYSLLRSGYYMVYLGFDFVVVFLLVILQGRSGSFEKKSVLAASW